MTSSGAPWPPIQCWRGRLAGCWVKDGAWGDMYYAGALLPDGGPCLVRARVEIDQVMDRVAPYLLGQRAVFAGEDIWAWGRCAIVRPQPEDCLRTSSA